jgi:hypothetical protein
MLPGVLHYRLGPFLLASEIPLPELEPLAAGVSPNAISTAVNSTAGTDVVSIRLGDVPENIANVVANESRWWASRHEYLLHVPKVANFLVRHGREVLVRPATGAHPADIRAYLLSPIFSTLCHQAGMYSLHASAVRIGAGVVAFLGNSGAGKSTLAAGLAQRGYELVSDDICLLDTRYRVETPAHGPVLVVPVAPALKLWRSALDHFGASPEALPRVFSRDHKYRIVIPQPPELPQRLPLREVLFLEWANQDSEDRASTQPIRASQPAKPSIFTPVVGVQAVARLMEFTHYDYLMKPTGRQSGNFLLCGQILSQARAFALSRPRGFSHLDRTLDALELHLATLKD